MTEKAGVHAKTKESEQKCLNSCKQKHHFHSSGSPTDRILKLQRTAGNQAVQMLIKSGALHALSFGKYAIQLKEEGPTKGASAKVWKACEMPGKRAKLNGAFLTKLDNMWKNESARVRYENLLGLSYPCTAGGDSYQR